MKKSLFLLPLLAGLALCGCDKGGNGGGSGGGGGGGGSGGGDEPFAGLTLDIETLDGAGDTSVGGYARLAEVDEIDGVGVGFQSVMVNGLNSTSIPKWVTPGDEKVEVIQMKKSEASITVYGNVSKVTLEIYSSYTWAETGLPTIEIGNAKVKKPSSAKSEVETECESWNSKGTQSFPLKLMTVEYSVAEGAEGDVVISNTNSFALYLNSIVLE